MLPLVRLTKAPAAITWVGLFPGGIVARRANLLSDNAGIAQALPDDEMIGVHGYRPWAYNLDGEKRLWTESLELVGLKADA